MKHHQTKDPDKKNKDLDKKNNETSSNPEKKMKELEENLCLESSLLLRLLEPSPSLPGFSLSQTVWVREIWVRGVYLLHGFCLGLISPICSFFVVCCFFVFLVWVPSSFNLGFFLLVLFFFFV